MKQHLVKEVMTPIEKIVKISPYARLRELLKLMKKHSVKSVIVDRMGSHDAYGIVTYSDILDAIYTQEGDMDLINVYDIATKPMIQVVSPLDIRYAARLMVRHKVTRLSVTWEGELVGLVTMSDITNVLMDEAVLE
ncbi:MAG: CBS domain-containing protein [Campylobacterota bacterium]|nr:CBS domain-containing protein [Campylobacterota bacterium]